MLIKQADDKAPDIETLNQLLKHPQIDAATADRVRREIRNVRSGWQTENEAAYEIDFHHKDSKNWAVIHDLRIDYQGRVAQIDHLLMNRFMEFWVCETKSFSQGVEMNERGEFTRFYQGRGYGIASPIEQNRKHMAVLESVLASSLVQLPTRLGMVLQPRLNSVVLVGANARVKLPKKPVPGSDSIIKSDQLRTWIERSIDGASGLSAVLSVAKAISSETLEQLARQVARLHRRHVFDWSAKFGLKALPESQGMPTDATSLPSTAASMPAPVPVAAGVQSEATFGSLEPAQVPSASASDAMGARGDKLPTSKLGALLGLGNAAQTLDHLERAGYLIATPEGHRLTDKAVACGAVFVEKGRYAPYFLWPPSLRV